MTHLILHNPSSHAHLEDLKDRVSQSLAGRRPRSQDRSEADALIAMVTQVVRAMEAGDLSLADVRAVLSGLPLPGFSIDSWVDEMLEEGVYLEGGIAQAA